MSIKRHELPFPMEKLFLTETLANMWKQGWLDDFSENHFLIRALKGDKFIRTMLKQRYNACTPEMLFIDGNLEMTFCINFASKIKLLIDVFGEEKIKGFVTGQLSAGKKHYNDNQFFEALTEIEILLYYIQFGPGWATGVYEPRIGRGNHNPEATITYTNGTRIDIEVKTPEFTNVIQNADIYMPLQCLTPEGIQRFEKICKKYKATFQRPRVSKLKSFIDSACEKFVIPLDEKHYNILFINWTYTEIPINGFVEPASILNNPYNGIFNHKDMAKKVGISEELYTKITAIFIFQNPLEAIVFHDLRYLFATRKAVLLLNPFILNTEQKIELFHKTIHMYQNDFVLKEIPSLYYNVNGYLSSYIANRLKQVIEENRIC